MADETQGPTDSELGKGAAPEQPEPAPAPAPAPEGHAGNGHDREGEAGDGGERLVPLAVLREERERRQAAERRQTEQMAKLDARLEHLAGLANRGALPSQAPVAETPIPEFADDPAGHLKAKLERLDGDRAKFAAFYEQSQKQAREAQQEAGFRATYLADVQKHMEGEPSYRDDFNGLYQQQVAIAEAAGLPRDVAEAMFVEWERYIVNAAMQQGRSPAAAVHAAARKLTGKAAEPAAQRDEDGRFQSQKPPPAPKSLGQAAGSSAGGQINAKVLMEMSDSEFSKATEGDKWRKLFSR